MAPIERDGDADVLPVEGAAAAATELRCISWGGARVVSCRSGTGGNIGSGLANSGTVPSATPIRGVVGARESSDGAVSSDTAAEAAPSTGDTAAPAASAARAARALASTAGSADDSWAWPISQGRLRFYPRKRVSVRRLPPRPRPISRSSATCARLAHSRSWGGHSNEGSTLSRPGGCILGRVTSLAL